MPASPTPAALALQSALVASLVASADLTILMGASRIFDDVPPGTPYPYVTIGQTVERDWSTGSDFGSEHTVTLHVWSREPGRRQVHQIVGLMRAALASAPLTLADHRLVNLRHEFSDARRESDGETYHALVRYRAVTEPL
jgi:hypothetical protein